MIKCLYNMKKKEKETAVKKFLELHQSSTEECAIDCTIDDYHIMFFPRHGDTLHCIDDIVKFAEYYNSHVFCCYYGGKVTAII